MEAIIDDVEAAQNRTKDAESNMIGKLKLLKDNIAQARAQAAKVIDVSVTLLQNLQYICLILDRNNTVLARRHYRHMIKLLV